MNQIRICLVSLTTAAALAAPTSPSLAARALFKRVPKAYPTYSAVVVSNGDVDTLQLKKANGQVTKARIHSIDGPEVAHNSKEHDQPYAQEAKAKTAKLAVGKKVTIEEVGKYPWPPFDPVVEVTLPDATNLGDELVKAGCAWVDPRYRPSSVRLDEQKAAKAAGNGLWALPNPVAPWDWRKNGDAKK